MACTQGALARAIFEPGASPHTFDASSLAVDFLYESLQKQGRLIGGKAITGSRSQYAAPTRAGSYVVGGRFATYTSSIDLDWFLPYVLGGTESADVFDVTDALPTFGVMVDKVGGVFEYQDCKISSCFWRGKATPTNAEPELIEQVIEIASLDEDATVSWPGTPPTIGTGGNRSPYILADSTLTVGGTTFQIKDVVILVDNAIQRRFVNSLPATELCATDRTVMLRVSMPFTAVSDAVFSGIYKHASRLTGVSADINFAPSGKGYSTKFAFEGLQWVQTTPVIRGKQEIDLVVDFIARKTGAASELVVTNDSVA